jgi:hypothetical protein
MLLSTGGSSDAAMLLQPLERMSYGFIPVASQAEAETSQAAQPRLLELVILAESPDCPDRALRADDGHFHTGDLFQEILPGHYLSKGRDDDWIKSENSLRCDTKYVLRSSQDGMLAYRPTGPSRTTFVQPAAIW